MFNDRKVLCLKTMQLVELNSPLDYQNDCYIKERFLNGA